jgi:hypothetical protein
MADHGRTWRRSTHCADSACIEVRTTADTVIVRSTTNPGAALTLDAEQWADLLDSIKAGELDLTRLAENG